MTENEAIERLRKLETDGDRLIRISMDGRHKEIEMAISALEEIQQYRALGTVEELREAMEKQKWIPCSERFPEDGKKVLVWFEYFRYGNYNRLFQTYGISYTYQGKWSGFVNGSSGWNNLNIIAWQPLPEPYRPA